MSTPTLRYWKAGQPNTEDRKIRIFISHRFEADSSLYDQSIAQLRSQGHGIEDLSLNVERLIQGPRGGQLPALEVKAQVAARIYTSDILLAPARPATSRSEWLGWEIELAAVGYSLPVLFIKEPEFEYNARIVGEIQGLALRTAIAERRPEDIVRKTIELIGGRPTWDMRFEEPNASTRFRGPPSAQLQQVMRLFPFQPRI